MTPYECNQYINFHRLTEREELTDSDRQKRETIEAAVDPAAIFNLVRCVSPCFKETLRVGHRPRSVAPHKTIKGKVSDPVSSAMTWGAEHTFVEVDCLNNDYASGQDGW